MNKFISERLRYLACRYLLFWLPDTWFLSLNYFFYHLGSGWHRLSVTPWGLARLRREFLAWEATDTRINVLAEAGSVSGEADSGTYVLAEAGSVSGEADSGTEVHAKAGSVSGAADTHTNYLVETDGLDSRTESSTTRPLIDQVFEEFDRTQVLPPNFDLAIMQLMLAARPAAGPQLADKLSFRAEVERILGPEFLVPLLQESDSAEGLEVQEEAVYKASHGCGWNQFELQRSWMKRWLSSDFYWVSREWTYRGLRPRAFAEQKLKGQTHPDWPEGLTDFKVFVHRGKAKLIQLNLQRHSGHRTAYYSPDWKRLNMALNFEGWKKNLSKPQGIDLLLEISEKLARSYSDILFIRIDAYIVKGLIYLGECTFHPGGGNMRFLK